MKTTRIKITGPDRIVYQLVSNAGGIDGRDKDPGGKVMFASFDRDEAESRKNNWQTLKLVALTGQEIVALREAAIAKLDGLELLLINTDDLTDRPIRN